MLVVEQPNLKQLDIPTTLVNNTNPTPKLTPVPGSIPTWPNGKLTVYSGATCTYDISHVYQINTSLWTEKPVVRDDTIFTPCPSTTKCYVRTNRDINPYPNLLIQYTTDPTSIDGVIINNYPNSTCKDVSKSIIKSRI